MGGNQLGFGDALISRRTKLSKLQQHQSQIDQIIDWQPIVKLVESIDRLSFQRLVGIYLDQEIPDFTTFWRFKESLQKQPKLTDRHRRHFEQKGRYMEVRL